MQKILIIQTSFIGDVVLATALVEKLAHDFPEAKLDFLLRKGNESLLDNNPHINKILIWNKKKGKYRNLFQLLKEVRKQHYYLVINLQRFFSTGFLTAFSKARMKIGFKKNPLSFLFTKRYQHEFGTKENSIHEIERNALLIKDLTHQRKRNAQIFKPKLYPSKSDFSIIPIDKKYVCLAPFSVWKTKELPKHKWIELIGKLPKKLTIFLLGGPGDFDKCEKLKSNFKNDRVINSAGKLTFLESSALMSKAEMNYVNDSAPLHFASAINAPVTAFFCSTVPRFGFTPLSDVSIIKETKENLECRPCGLHGKKKCPKGHFMCGEIEV